MRPPSPASESARAAFLIQYHGATRESYGLDLRYYFWKWCAPLDRDPLDVERAEIEAYLRWLDEGLYRAPRTIARHLTTIKGFYKAAEIDGRIDRSPAIYIRGPRIHQDPPPSSLTWDQAVAFLDVAQRAGPRDHALACLLLLNGLRATEACSGRISDLSTERGHRVLTITRKGGARDRIALDRRTVAAIELVIDGRETGPILLSDAGGPLERYHEHRIVRRLGRAIGVAKMSAITLRRTAITLSLDAGMPLRDVQDFAGHADPRSTRRYDSGRGSLDRHATYQLSQFLSGGRPSSVPSR